MKTTTNKPDSRLPRTAGHDQFTADLTRFASDLESPRARQTGMHSIRGAVLRLRDASSLVDAARSTVDAASKATLQAHEMARLKGFADTVSSRGNDAAESLWRETCLARARAEVALRRRMGGRMAMRLDLPQADASWLSPRRRTMLEVVLGLGWQAWKLDYFSRRIYGRLSAGNAPAGLVKSASRLCERLQVVGYIVEQTMLPDLVDRRLSDRGISARANDVGEIFDDLLASINAVGSQALEWLDAHPSE